MTEALSTERIWSEFSAQLRGFIRSRVRDAATADDLLQETFLKIHTRLPQLRNREQLAPWIYRIARNTITDHFRALRHPESLESSGATAVPAIDPPDHDDHHMNQLVGLWLRGFLATIPEEYRQAVEMVELEGKTMEELAEATGLSISGAKARVQRGRKMLRQRLHDCCHVELDRRGNVLGVQPNACCVETAPLQQIRPARKPEAATGDYSEAQAPRGSQPN